MPTFLGSSVSDPDLNPDPDPPIHMFLGLPDPDPDPDPLVRGMDPDPGHTEMAWIQNTATLLLQNSDRMNLHEIHEISYFLL
jgi:hypothetical protein